MNTKYTIGMKVKARKKINVFGEKAFDLEGTIVSIEENMIRIQCRQNSVRSEVYNIRPEHITEIVAPEPSKPLKTDPGAIKPHHRKESDVRH